MAKVEAMAAPAIVADDLVKCFGDVEAVKGVSFEVPEGQVLGLLGPNGAGKTTAVRMLTTLLKPDGGTARVLGVDVRKDPQRVRASIGLAGQYAAVDENLTGRENLALVGQADAPAVGGDHRPCRRAARAVRAQRTPPTACRARTPEGMRRRLDLAAALVHRPPVLFLDEPTTGLDPQGRNELWGVIEDARERWHHRAAHHAVPRRGRHARRQHRGHRPRQRDRRGHRHRS